MTEFDLPLHAYINCDAIIGKTTPPELIHHASLPSGGSAIDKLSFGSAHGSCTTCSHYPHAVESSPYAYSMHGPARQRFHLASY